jgi:hypothetical protein
MKKLLILLVTFGLFSCETEELPRDFITEETAFVDMANLKLGLNGVYGSISNTGVIAFNSIFTDECKIGKDNGGQETTLYGMILNPALNDKSIWTNSYRAINLSNRLIRGAKNVTPTVGEQVEYNNLLAACYAARVYAHLNVFSHYTTDMQNPAGLAIPYVDVVIDNNVDPKRNTVAEVKAKMIADIDLALSLYTPPAVENVTFFTKDALLFMKAKIYLFTASSNADYQAAIDNANLVLASKPIATAAQYPGVFTDINNNEVVFKLKRTIADGRIGGVWYFTGTGGAFIEMSRQFFNLLSSTDVRRDVLFTAGTTPGPNVHLINKYPGSATNPYLNDIKVMRSSELVFIKAEAQARLSLFTDSNNTLNSLINARYSLLAPVSSYTNLQNAMIRILQERRIELAYEGHRYVDLRRLKGVTNIGINRDPLDCAGYLCDLPVSDHRFTLPIPINSINNNPNMVQNPGY